MDPILERCGSCGAPPGQCCSCLDIRPDASFNGLSHETAELFAVLAEECGEVVQRVGKLLRHGIRVNPYSDSDLTLNKTNAHYLEEELTDIFTIVDMLGELGVVSVLRIREGIPAKRERLSRPGIMHHSSILGEESDPVANFREIGHTKPTIGNPP